ncbi:MAG: hypothetical protein D3922_09125, partial [Candidatus Electrothrix sp. AR1]|nr:hypothetical protein [Candidatus Electrothrix sp. AR1]
MVDVSSSQWNFDQLPCRHEEPPSKCGGIFFIVVGAFLGGLPTWILIKSILKGSFEAYMLLWLFFVVSGIGLFLLGLFGFSWRTVTEFDGKTFRFRSKSLFHSKAWDEPLSGYEGILMRCEYDSDSDGPSTLYIVELIHPDRQHRIKLWQSDGPFDHRASWKKYSRQLGLPALKQDGEGYTRRVPDDIDKSVRELAVESKLEVTFDPAAAVPDELELNIQGDQLEVVICEKTPLWVILIVTLLFFPLPASLICAWLAGNIVFGILGIFIWVSIIRA